MKPLHRAPLRVLLGLLTSIVILAPDASMAVRAAGDTDPVALKPKWEVGRRQVMRVSMVQEQRIPMPNVAEPVQQVTTQVQEFSTTALKALDGGGYEIEVEFLHIVLNSRMGSQIVLDFDSKKDAKDDAANPLGAMLRPLAGAKLKVYTTPSGKVDRVEGLKELADKVSSGAPAMMAGMMQSLVSEDMFKQMGIVPVGLPDDPVKPGDEWPVRMDYKLGTLGTLTTSMTMTFKGWETREGRRCVALTHKGRMWSQPPASGGTAPMARITGDTEGTSWFDPEAGYTVDSVATQTLQIKVSAMGTEMNIQSRQSLTNRVVEVSR
ncbi:MAG TPA: DUF6263 family protein [Verrucomicrobiota bacterium]|nr:DUF6263 family protein [Verrucomicrobiota bacterium]HNU50788.1 DUF6263 family protein [Verrucomicrobiota bacterium]